MSASLVGAEMCIRDRYYEVSQKHSNTDSKYGYVSYTHLTLPTKLEV
ncbi:hypothetical protein JMUB7547_28750 [Staphylococcus aureus]